ncbi:MAG: glycosyltransferase family 4 protein [Polyangiales bacterium]
MSARLSLAVVIERFGDGITGGGEYHARRVAQHLADPTSRAHDVTILTSTSRDARRWDSPFTPGEDRVAGLRVLRFPVESSVDRDLERARQAALGLVGRSPVGVREAATTWANPYVPQLHAHLAATRYDAVFFFRYFYYPSIGGAHRTDSYRVGVPLLHDEPSARRPSVRRYLRALDAIVVNTDEERELVYEVGGDLRAPVIVAGCGVDPPSAAIGPRPFDAAYVAYFGRRKDGTELLPEMWRAFRERYGGARFTDDRGRSVRGDALKLVTIGEPSFREIAGDGWHVEGHVDEATRWRFAAHAEAIVNPSLHESLSLVILEGWWVGRPVLVRAQCRVMARQVQRAEAGAAFRDAISFADALAAMLRGPDRRRVLGENGRAFATSRYEWSTVMRRYDDALARRFERVGERGQ